jgi:hypothetical protein
VTSVPVMCAVDGADQDILIYNERSFIIVLQQYFVSLLLARRLEDETSLVEDVTSRASLV